jgi:hypothetical protein
MSFSPGGESILFRWSDWRPLGAGRRRNIFECYCAFNVFASENGGLFPLYEYADVRGHGRERGAVDSADVGRR